jgi:hypothetical protein
MPDKHNFTVCWVRRLARRSFSEAGRLAECRMLFASGVIRSTEQQNAQSSAEGAAQQSPGWKSTRQRALEPWDPGECGFSPARAAQQLCRPCRAGSTTVRTRGFTPGLAVARIQRWDLLSPRLKRILNRAEAKSMRHWASRRQEAARSRILNIQKQIRHMIRDYSLLVLLCRRVAGVPSKPQVKNADILCFALKGCSVSRPGGKKYAVLAGMVELAWSSYFL